MLKDYFELCRDYLTERRNVKKLFLYSILLMREKSNEVSVQQGWLAVTDKLIQAGVYTDQAAVLQAWLFAFGTLPNGVFGRLMSGELESVYSQVAQLLAGD